MIHKYWMKFVFILLELLIYRIEMKRIFGAHDFPCSTHFFVCGINFTLFVIPQKKKLFDSGEIEFIILLRKQQVIFWALAELFLWGHKIFSSFNLSHFKVSVKKYIIKFGWKEKWAAFFSFKGAFREVSHQSRLSFIWCQTENKAWNYARF